MEKIDYVDLELETGLDRMELEMYLKGTCFKCPTTSKCLGNDCSLYEYDQDEFDMYYDD